MPWAGHICPWCGNDATADKRWWARAYLIFMATFFVVCVGGCGICAGIGSRSQGGEQVTRELTRAR